MRATTRSSCAHEYRRARGGRAVVCTWCGDRFPCRSCRHLDCIDARGDRFPADVVVRDGAGERLVVGAGLEAVLELLA